MVGPDDLKGLSNLNYSMMIQDNFAPKIFSPVLLQLRESEIMLLS